MAYRTTAIFIYIVSCAAVSCAISDIALFPAGKIPKPPPPVGPEVCEPGFANAIMCSNVTVPSLVPFLVEGATSCVIIAPGGGFHALSYSTEGSEVAAWLNSIGISAFVLKYRVPADFGYHETPMMDAQRAVRLIRSRAAGLGLNASQIGFMGFSAGGDLAAGMAANFAERAYTRIDSVDDQSCRPDFAMMGYPAVHDWARNITSEHPPAFFAQAENDPVNSSLTVEYYLKLRSISAAPADLHIFHGNIHGYGLCKTRDAQGRIPCLVAPPDGPGLMPAWVPWSDVCLWPTMAEAFLRDLGLAKQDKYTIS